MRHPAPKHRFSAWDGSQSLPLDADQILEALADDLMEYGDLRWAMRNLMSRGMQMPQGGYMQGLRDMLKQLRDKKRQRLEQFDLSSIFDDFKERLDEIVGQRLHDLVCIPIRLLGAIPGAIALPTIKCHVVILSDRCLR